ncbi:uncharacterized protein AB675_9033 [Cyphellophora attinorum]|uniref:TRIP4/RQT4 C2HC5-type zinc finger domain-containing protein n=1 Tax=Cyphellophora attinorum TaxID=1664694 RepID=A0A0N1H6E2_9EURO|nr:uncharacterized protein AB675_9033 [Phialophora attinorum]KPI41577.1 hypothetical protein AB675_9033 [Phialophora attinorum]
MVGSAAGAGRGGQQGNLISEFMPNVRTKTKKAHGSSNAHATTTASSSSIADLSSAISQLEMTTNPSIPSKPRVCTCNASIHPLFDMAPNCLSCGKIICAFEGLQPCSFCGTKLVSDSETQQILTSLRQERGTERQTAHNSSIAASRSGTPSLSNTPSRGPTPVSSSDSLRQNAALEEAKARRDRLLTFQSENAQRTKVHDEAADFSTITPGQAQWMTPVQRAAALKQQQKYLRDLEEASKPEYEKTRSVMSLGFNKQGKLVKTFEKQRIARPDPEEAEAEIDAEPASSGQNTPSANPFAREGLIRPIWKPSAEAGSGSTTAARKNTWRRVQDDEA